MRWLRCLLLAALTVSGTARNGWTEEQPPKFGKTNSEILALGVGEWVQLHGGGSYSDWEALATYRSAQRWRNDRLAARVSPDLRRRVNRLRPLLVRYTKNMHDISLYLAGGGTIWSGVEGENLVDSEETIYALLGGKAEPARPLVVSTVAKVLDALQADVDAPPDAPLKEDDPYADPLPARAALASARAAFSRIVKIAATFDRKGSDRILAFCADLAIVMDDDGPAPYRVPETASIP
jgi:hypothetical protein